MAQVIGIGGIFLRSRDSARLAVWYRDNLGVPMNDNGTVTFHWLDHATEERPGTTTLALFANDTEYFGEPGQRAMLNFRVDDLGMLMAKLK
ncbi:MAG TPA: VOC family protein, partial [Pseudonocardiaceae bacterium]|nr:VOC family protein [Pseudonocardiaceae bacterium]